MYITSPPDVLSRLASTFEKDQQEEEEGQGGRRRRRRERYAFLSMCGECASKKSHRAREKNNLSLSLSLPPSLRPTLLCV